MVTHPNVKKRTCKVGDEDQTRPATRREPILDPVLAMLEAAPLADDPASEEELESLRVGWEEYRAGLTIPGDEIKRAYQERRRAESR